MSFASKVVAFTGISSKDLPFLLPLFNGRWLQPALPVVYAQGDHACRILLGLHLPLQLYCQEVHYPEVHEADLVTLEADGGARSGASPAVLLGPGENKAINYW